MPNLVYMNADFLFAVKDLPLQIHNGKTKAAKKTFCHLNAFVNLGNRMSQNSLKQNYAQWAKPCFPPAPATPYAGPVKLLLIYHRGTQHRKDLGNMCAVVLKFAEDILVNKGYLADDDVNNVVDIHYHYGGFRRGSEAIDLYVFKQPSGTI